ncbi:hypothetical protein HCN51_36430 [Nonomuraea sp. FMUSA5-5]|uniref:DUF3592 domain-containing protein n=1 Tax=Nonomuraea composti TaxID=2720023 RepID=A0ABX1BIF3_9ACTN|nr:hypothetical protein [Nonomuraea sp. FMUSA5-5]NJP94863.1 hypothetical protein [Nonomuraea sp. FMUSA5-5]
MTRATDPSPAAEECRRALPRALLAGAAFLLVCLLPLSATVGVFAATASTGWAALALVVGILAGAALSVVAGVFSEGDPEPLIGCFAVAMLLGLGLGVNGAIHLEQGYQHWYGVSKQARISLVQVDKARRGVHCRYILGGAFADRWTDDFPVETLPHRAACQAKVGTVIEVVVDPRRRVQSQIADEVEGIDTALWAEGVLLALAGLGGPVTAGLAFQTAKKAAKARRAAPARLMVDRVPSWHRQRPRRRRQ